MTMTVVYVTVVSEDRSQNINIKANKPKVLITKVPNQPLL